MRDRERQNAERALGPVAIAVGLGSAALAWLALMALRVVL
mgnify:CR=1 FL=1